MPLENGMRAMVSKREEAEEEPAVKSASAGGEASMEEKGMAELFGGTGPTRINFVPWQDKQAMLDRVLPL